MSYPKTLLIAIVAGGIALTGCAQEAKQAKVEPEKTTPTVSETERPGDEAKSDINPMTAKLRISDLKVGPRLGATGSVENNEDELLAGEPLHASVAVGDAGAGSQVKAVWTGPAGQRIGEESKAVEAGVAFLVFNAPSTAGWAPGDYKVEIFLGDELAASESFDIIEKRPA